MATSVVSIKARLARAASLRPAWADLTFFLASLAAAAVVVPGRWKAIVLAIVGWSFLFRVFRQNGYGFLSLAAAALFWLLLYAEQLNYANLPRATIPAYLALTGGLFALIVVLHQSLRGPGRYLAPLVAAGATITLSTAACLYVWHALKMKMPIGSDLFYAAYQTTPSEFIEFVTTYADTGWLVGGLIILALGAAGLWLAAAPQSKIDRRAWGIPAVAALAVLIPFHGSLRVLDHLTTTASTTAKTYRREMQAFRELQRQRAAGTTVIHAAKQGQGETYVLVLGESLNRNHMSLYGYHRTTTPVADSLYRAGVVLKFTNAYATDTYTARAVPLALTAASRRNRVGEPFDAPSLIEVAKAAGFETHWITNQLLYGGWDNAVSVLAHAADHLVRLNRNVGETAHTQLYDEAAVPALESILATPTSRNRLIVVHLMGSHMQYCNRFPASFDRFTGPLARGEFGRATREDRKWNVNCYDNSVLYSDYVVGRLLDTTRRHGGIAALLYMADHGEDVLARRGHYGGDRFTFPMVEVPLVFWASEPYQQAYERNFDLLRARSEAVFPSEYLFDTMLGIAGVASAFQDSVLDLSHPAYGRGSAEYILLKGTRRFLDSTNVRYYQRRNIARLAEAGLMERVLPHRVNSTGKLSQVVYDGFRALEVDVMHRSGPSSFEVGHDEDHASRNELGAFLARIPARDKIWLDVKNLTPENLADTRAELIRLDERLGLKKVAIVESPETELLRSIAGDGFHTSFYVPTERVVELERAGSRDSLRAEARRIAERTRNGGIAALSFDARLYRFVKVYVEPLIPREVVYHTWDTPLSFADPDFYSKLKSAAYFQDRRVRTILVTYESALTL
jgi:glucan phosphoethanolaminetransferase (alkaline phosphatase superfamily)